MVGRAGECPRRAVLVEPLPPCPRIDSCCSAPAAAAPTPAAACATPRTFQPQILDSCEICGPSSAAFGGLASEAPRDGILGAGRSHFFHSAPARRRPALGGDPRGQSPRPAFAPAHLSLAPLPFLRG